MLRIFVADDSADLRERIVKMLSILPNVEVVGEASDGAETISEVRDLKPGLVMLDLQMPRLGGLDILPTIKANQPPPIVLILTNYATSRHREVCARLGADYFFDKSTEFEKAIGVIETVANPVSIPGRRKQV